MRNRKRTNAALLGLAIGMVLALLAAPHSRWLVGAQLRMAATADGAETLGLNAIPLDGAWAGEGTPPASVLRRVEAGAARRPMDILAQAGAAFWRIQASGRSSQHDVLAECEPLLQRYPDRPEVAANALRVAAMGMAIPKRPGAAGTVRPAGLTPSVSATEWKRYLAIARNGERIDPDNGYFTAMAGVATFALGSEQGALTALDRAAVKPAWRQYVPEMTRGAWRAGDASFGPGNTFWRLSVPVSIRFGDAALLSETGKRLARRADALDLAGNAAEAIRMRTVLIRLGARMRNESTSLMGVRAGQGLQQLAFGEGSATPAGPPLPRSAWRAAMAPIPRPIRPPAVPNAFASRPAVQAQVLANAEVTNILNAGTDRFDLLRGLRGYTLWYLAGQLLIDSALWLIALGAIAWAAGRVKHRAAIWAMTALGVAALGVGCSELANGMAGLEPALQATNQTGDVSTSWSLLALATLLPSAIVFAIISVEAYGEGEPAGQQYFRRFALWCIPAACLMTMCYGLVTVRTVRVGETINRSLIRMVDNEGRFYADLAGKPWPNVPYPSAPAH